MMKIFSLFSLMPQKSIFTSWPSHHGCGLVRWQKVAVSSLGAKSLVLQKAITQVKTITITNKRNCHKMFVIQTYLWHTSILYLACFSTDHWPVTKAIVNYHVVSSKCILLVLHNVPCRQVQVNPMSLTASRWVVPHHHEWSVRQKELGCAPIAIVMVVSHCCHCTCSDEDSQQ